MHVICFKLSDISNSPNEFRPTESYVSRRLLDLIGIKFGKRAFEARTIHPRKLLFLGIISSERVQQQTVKMAGRLFNRRRLIPFGPDKLKVAAFLAHVSKLEGND